MSRRMTRAQKASIQPAIDCGRIRRFSPILLLDGTHYAGRPPMKVVCVNGDEFRVERCGRSILLSTSPTAVLVDCAACSSCRETCAAVDPEAQAGWSLAVRAAPSIARKATRMAKWQFATESTWLADNLGIAAMPPPRGLIRRDTVYGIRLA
jgi:hypothetical protein